MCFQLLFTRQGPTVIILHFLDRAGAALDVALLGFDVAEGGRGGRRGRRSRDSQVGHRFQQRVDVDGRLVLGALAVVVRQSFQIFRTVLVVVLAMDAAHLPKAVVPQMVIALDDVFRPLLFRLLIINMEIAVAGRR